MIIVKPKTPSRRFLNHLKAVRLFNFSPFWRRNNNFFVYRMWYVVLRDWTRTAGVRAKRDFRFLPHGHKPGTILLKLIIIAAKEVIIWTNM